MEYIEKWLRELKEIIPLTTEEKPAISNPENIKAIIFDIYGTLLVSASGDIEQAEISGNNLKTALREAGYAFSDPAIESDDKLTADLLSRFVKLIHQHQETQHQNGTPFPEVDIRKVWEDLVEYAVKSKILVQEKNADPVKLTFIFELLSNQVWPMPGMKEIIGYLHDKGYPLGIVSNAQFYTPVMMNFFLTNKINMGEEISYFDPELTVFSYKLLKAKPDKKIFEPVLRNLRHKFGIRPEESVFIGNDMYKDIYTANASGMKTIFFAGDKRSLRLRKNQPEVKGLKPDAVITELEQLKQIF
jgi:putative hydrolase of the HAD superfamily